MARPIPERWNGRAIPFQRSSIGLAVQREFDVPRLSVALQGDILAPDRRRNRLQKRSSIRRVTSRKQIDALAQVDCGVIDAPDTRHGDFDSTRTLLAH
jgi:hypothetical protein